MTCCAFDTVCHGPISPSVRLWLPSRPCVHCTTKSVLAACMLLLAATFANTRLQHPGRSKNGLFTPTPDIITTYVCEIACHPLDTMGQHSRCTGLGLETIGLCCRDHQRYSYTSNTNRGLMTDTTTFPLRAWLQPSDTDTDKHIHVQKIYYIECPLFPQG